MSYRDEFPDYDAATLPAIPDGWTDLSWHNDACPSFAFFEAGEGDSNHQLARVWVDYAEPENRETGGLRFSVSYEGGENLEGFDALATDDWAEILAYVAARQELGAAYVASVGYNPFLDNPAIDPVEVAATLAEINAQEFQSVSGLASIPVARTIDLTPTWRGILPLLLAGIENGTPTGRAHATIELRRMADIADKYVADHPTE